MKKLYFLFIVTIITNVSASCHAQKMMASVNDAIKLENSKQQFIGKPLKVLLDQIGPQIKFVIGNPDNQSFHATEGTFLRFHFIDKSDFVKRKAKNDIATMITVNFKIEPDNTRKHLPIEGILKWTDAETKEYGDMIIVAIRVKGKD
ncbi:MAG: hypothetical protein BGN92_13215 [Sphingobacteriales bacterium 41-5]|nr:MAG: hypothetical protein BGN92_13215 [Sphingobacteriales bacterium 41-5]